VIDVLRGKATDKVKKFGHDKLSTFGIGADLAEAEWRLLLRQLVAQRLVDVDYDRYNVLQLTDASRVVLRGERTVELRRQVAAPTGRSRRAKKASLPSSDAPPLGAAEAALFERLRSWRAQVAREHGVPAYVVFHDSTLRAIAQARPANVEALGTIAGLGERRLANYGAALLAVVVAES